MHNNLHVRSPISIIDFELNAKLEFFLSVPRCKRPVHSDIEMQTGRMALPLCLSLSLSLALSLSVSVSLSLSLSLSPFFFLSLSLSQTANFIGL